MWACMWMIMEKNGLMLNTVAATIKTNERGKRMNRLKPVTGGISVSKV